MNFVITITILCLLHLSNHLSVQSDSISSSISESYEIQAAAQDSFVLHNTIRDGPNKDPKDSAGLRIQLGPRPYGFSGGSVVENVQFDSALKVWQIALNFTAKGHDELYSEMRVTKSRPISSSSSIADEGQKNEVIEYRFSWKLDPALLVNKEMQLCFLIDKTTFW